MTPIVTSLVRTIAIALAGAAVPAALLTGERAADAHDSVSVSVVVTADLPTFHAALSPYGTWMDRPGGEVWVPNAAVVGPHFRPYDSGGGWVYTDEGWYFDTAWEWGAIPFHYGRWTFEPTYGWVWVAGYDWAPAWVDWSYGGGYVGWAPLPPAGVTVEIGSPHWYFVEERHFAAPHVTDHVLPAGRAHYAATVATPIRTPHSGGGRWYAGPAAGAVSRASGRPILAARISAPARGADYRVAPERHGPAASPTRLPAVKGPGPRAPLPVRAPAPSRMAPGPAASRMAPGRVPSHKVTTPAPAPARPSPARSDRAPGPAPSHLAPAPMPSRKLTSPAPAPRPPPPARSDMRPGPGPSPKMTSPAPRPAPAPRPPPPARSTVSRPPEHAPPPAGASPSPRPRPAPPAGPAKVRPAK
ncbi:MAG TPA: DUF6600 domain-containing protein [Myxococcota bacterium]|nr:DUF6600 domain-containing protein [Myxococcota bacterium]